jgi:hypothetical protein
VNGLQVFALLAILVALYLTERRPPMTARDTIAEALARTDGSEFVLDWCRDYADAVIAAVRAMPVEDQAELIGGVVDNGTGYFAPRIRRAIGPWVKS